MYIHHSFFRALIAPILFVIAGVSLYFWIKHTYPRIPVPPQSKAVDIAVTPGQKDATTPLNETPAASSTPTSILGSLIPGIAPESEAGAGAVDKVDVHMNLTLDVPLYYQLRPLSCEIASLRMALAGKGVTVTEKDIFDIIGIDARPRDSVNNIWADPDLVFVGNVDGSQNTTGYGVHWDPIGEAARKWRDGSEAFTNGTLEFVIDELRKGNPVVTWGLTGKYKTPDSWVTPEGRTINTWRGEHARVLVGFEGDPARPDIYIFKDPNDGILRWTEEQFLEDWAKFNYSGVVVR